MKILCKNKTIKRNVDGLIRRYIKTFNWKDILVFEVKKSKNAFLLKRWNMKEFYVRGAASTRKLEGDDILAYMDDHFK